MKRFIKFALLLTLALGFAGCSGDGTLENGPEVTYEMAEPRLLDGERQEILRVPVEVDCKAMLHYTYTTADADGAVLWLENDGETLLMDELAAATNESYENDLAGWADHAARWRQCVLSFGADGRTGFLPDDAFAGRI